MDPATAFSWIVAISASAWLVATALIPATFRFLTLAARRISSLSGPVAFLVTVILLVAVVRPSASAAVTPPPYVRIVTSSDPGAAQRSIGTPIGVSHGVAPGVTVHTVVRGDSLWGIARGVLSGTFDRPTGEQITRLWKEIYRVNRGVIGSDPNLILPGQVLSIPGGNRG